jgi:endonuclease/exonuclease/phosphatase family metal-dependent hydrolase
MSRFIAIFSQCFGLPGGTIIRELGADVTTRQEAWAYAEREAYRRTDDFNTVTPYILEIGDKETTHFAPRKLTWKERFTGRIDPTITESVPVEKIDAVFVAPDLPLPTD